MRSKFELQTYILVERKSLQDHQRPLSIAFQKANFDICKMFIIRGVKNPVLQWIHAAGRTTVDITDGLKMVQNHTNFEKVLEKDLDRLNDFVNDKHVRDGLQKLIEYLKPEMEDFINKYFRQKWGQKVRSRNFEVFLI